MKPKLLCFMLATILLISGCSSELFSASESTNPTQLQIPTAPSESAEPTSTAAPTTLPDLSIDVPAGSHRRTFTDDSTGDYLDYYLFIPEDVVKDMPLIIFLHGDGEVGNIDALESYGPIRAAREIYGENFPFIMISPCTRQKSWISGTIPDTLMGLIDSIVSECEIDQNHIIITGHSRGAIGTWYLISNYGDVFSAAVPVSCGSEGLLNYENLSSVPIFALAGNVGQYENEYKNAMKILVETIQMQGGTAEFLILDGRSHADTVTQAYSEQIFNWMLEQ